MRRILFETPDRVEYDCGKTSERTQIGIFFLMVASAALICDYHQISLIPPSLRNDISVEAVVLGCIFLTLFCFIRTRVTIDRARRLLFEHRRLFGIPVFARSLSLEDFHSVYLDKRTRERGRRNRETVYRLFLGNGHTCCYQFDESELERSIRHRAGEIAAFLNIPIVDEIHTRTVVLQPIKKTRKKVERSEA
ncbi:MAG TPA: hypothetical protein VEJ63_01295 [Planctomycetota bacterium]|nr:hypothetical protein [Planctomycetota bacterium]